MSSDSNLFPSRRTVGLALLAAPLLAAALLTLGATRLDAQEADAPLADAQPAGAEATVTAEAETSGPDAAEPAAAEPAAEAAAEPTAPDGPAEDAATPDEGPADEGPAEATPADAAEAESAAANGDAAPAASTAGGYVNLLVALAAIVLPIVFGNWLAARLKMPEHAWKVATVLATLTVAAVTVYHAATTGGFKGGPDLSGGITLIFETEKDVDVARPDDPDTDEAPEGDFTRRRIDMPQLVAAIKQRIDPAGTKEVTIRTSGADRIEVIIPNQSQDELELVKKRITDLGQLEFRILADPRWNADEDLIRIAQALGPSQKKVLRGDREVAKWAPVKADRAGDDFADDGRGVYRQATGRREALVKIDRYNVTGEHLVSPRSDVDVSGPIVRFNFNRQGSGLFSRLTGDNLPSASNPDVRRRLGILLDGTLISAPNLNSRIRNSGQIEGVGTQEDVDYLVSILDAGSLPAALNKTPLSENVISPTIGAETVEKGAYAIGVSLGAVLIFMLFYYRFAGLVACLALLSNILLVLAVMVLFDAAFTLPGLAGLVLTVGMSVDANVLIFERIREERNRGAAMRMAIRNGFGRATTTIIDANITTLITGVVLYTIGTDQIKGFAVTLVLGILMSMYTAIFASRVLFDIAERRRWISDLRFSSIIGATSLNFIGKRGAALACSLALIAVGLVAVTQRGEGLLNIDFTGGTSVTTVFDQDAAMPIGEVRTVLEDAGFGDGDFTVVEVGGDGTRYSIDSAIEEVADAEARLAEAFGERLQTFSVDIGEPESFTEGDATGARLPLVFNNGPGFGEQDGLSHDAVLERILNAAAAVGQKGLEPTLENPNYIEGTSLRFKQWTFSAFDLSTDDALAIARAVQQGLTAQPLFPVANKISGKVAGDLKLTAVFAILLSLIGIVGYLWFRFQNVSFGLAAVVALVHDVLMTLGALAASAWVVSGFPPLASALQLDAFQISLPIVAAFLTIIGYSLNDTIVVFDRIREVRGKSPDLTADMVNKSINQTLARTLLTSLTTLLVVGILYFFGGAGIHAFAFALVIGVIVGTYSSIFIASPALLAMVGKSSPASPSKAAA